ncbi:MAG: hypothetical protein CBB65_02265 [Hyphomonadaceae bacterium TMED5]|nr:hypothetical protein [Ponticaulis sp.]OUY01277.1 MAG: hypothetical protein CBB65_02265 [Hyphomonadaceae bacterium TMED5]|tara:strand:- start:26671 stop:27120 length:450 start_codon:yes stop_codon:yes gene_type:complete
MAGKSLMRAAALSVLLGLSLGGCAVDGLNTDPEVRGLSGSVSEQRLTEPRGGEEIVLSAGNTLRIELSANATTGYQWRLLPGMNDRILELMSQDYQSDLHPLGMTGVGGTAILVFRGVEEGETLIRLGYARPGAPPDVEREIAVSVIPR